MTTQVAQLPNHSPPEFTPEQLKLIRDTVAKAASPDELRLFLYRAKSMGLDPLKPGQVHFVKYGNNAGSIIVGIEGFRSIAHRTGKLSGIKRGSIRDEKGELVGAWAEVYRTDWDHPAREEVPIDEYRGLSPIWKKMPETMIKKVAECAALRMAFPNDLGGVYSPEEMDQTAPESTGVNPNAYGGPGPEDGHDDGVYRFPISYIWKDPEAPEDPKRAFQIKGLTLSRIHERIKTDGIERIVMEFEDILAGNRPKIKLTEQRTLDLKQFISAAESFLLEIEGVPANESE